jgi:hypothetical protein
MNHRPGSRVFAVCLALLVLSGLACSFSLLEWPFPGQPSPPGGDTPGPTPLPAAEVVFEVILPEPLLPGEGLALSLLDEVTGLALNATNYPMQGRDALRYSVSLPIAVNSVVKYRYVRLGSPMVIEDTGTGQPVRYRLFHAAAPGGVTDVISGWSDRPNPGPTGSILGQVKDQSDQPLPNILVAAGGVQAFTDSQGRFSLRALPPGTHNLVAYALDGSYRIFQQGATVADGMVTPVPIRLEAAPMVNVIFTVSVPRNTVVGAPLRMAGNLLQLGNTFSDLGGGMSVIADRMPVMTPLPDGRYTITLSLPAGADIRYKYSLGDGFWNAEHLASGEFRLRQLIVPETTALIQDVVETWQVGRNAPIVFEVIVPPNTPAGDVVSIQFHPYAWTEPIPMWPLGNNRWVYKLFSPLNMVGNFGYRYCRNNQCGSADDLLTPGYQTRGRSIATSLLPQDIQDTVGGWQWMTSTGQGALVSTEIQARGEGFVAGLEYQPAWHPTWQARMPSALQNSQALGANWVVLAPTWTYTGLSPLILAPQPGSDPLWNELQLSVEQARALNLRVAVFPTPRLSKPSGEWWREASRDDAWWNEWFEAYRTFILHHADLASRTGAQAVILGGDWLAPALPGGELTDGTPSGVPADADGRWRALIADVRARFRGQVWWALPYPADVDIPPGFLGETDGIYLLWYAPLSSNPSAAREEMEDTAGRQLDEDLQPWQASLDKPLILAVAYPSAWGAASSCPPDGQGGCLRWLDLSRPNPDIASASLDLQAQMDIYEALLAAVNTRPWVGGFVSRGYYPPAILLDKSASVHGKPAADVLWYWFPRLLGVSP